MISSSEPTPGAPLVTGCRDCDRLTGCRDCDRLTGGRCWRHSTSVYVPQTTVVIAPPVVITPLPAWQPPRG